MRGTSNWDTVLESAKKVRRNWCVEKSTISSLVFIVFLRYIIGIGVICKLVVIHQLGDTRCLC